MTICMCTTRSIAEEADKRFPPCCRARSRAALMQTASFFCCILAGDFPTFRQIFATWSNIGEFGPTFPCWNIRRGNLQQGDSLSFAARHLVVATLVAIIRGSAVSPYRQQARCSSMRPVARNRRSPMLSSIPWTPCCRTPSRTRSSCPTSSTVCWTRSPSQVHQLPSLPESLPPLDAPCLLGLAGGVERAPSVPQVALPASASRSVPRCSQTWPLNSLPLACAPPGGSKSPTSFALS